MYIKRKEHSYLTKPLVLSHHLYNVMDMCAVSTNSMMKQGLLDLYLTLKIYISIYTVHVPHCLDNGYTLQGIILV